MFTEVYHVVRPERSSRNHHVGVAAIPPEEMARRIRAEQERIERERPGTIIGARPCLGTTAARLLVARYLRDHGPTRTGAVVAALASQGFSQNHFQRATRGHPWFTRTFGEVGRWSLSAAGAQALEEA